MNHQINSVTLLCLIGQIAALLYWLTATRWRRSLMLHVNSGGQVYGGPLSHFLKPGICNIIAVTISISFVLSLIFFRTYFSLVFLILPLLTFRYLFVTLRYHGNFRGAGAPGFMAYWMLLYIVFLKVSSWNFIHLDAVILVMKLDFFLIFLSAGLYKVKTGYLNGYGIEFALVNPNWSFYSDFFSKLPANHWFFRVLNFLSVYSELIIAIFVLTPIVGIFSDITILGGFLLIAMFTLLYILVPLGLLSLTMITIGFFFINLTFLYNGTSFTKFMETLYSGDIFLLSLSLYVISLLISFFNNWNRFLLSFALPTAFQRIADYCNLITGSIIWSVFSANHNEIHLQYEINESKLPPKKYRVFLNAALARLGIGTKLADVHLGIAGASAFTFGRYTKDDLLWKYRLETFFKFLEKDLDVKRISFSIYRPKEGRFTEILAIDFDSNQTIDIQFLRKLYNSTFRPYSVTPAKRYGRYGSK